LGSWQFRNKLPTAHTDLSATVYLLNTVDNGALKKFGSCSQWHGAVNF
jgi:hypothetical protein